MEPSSRQVPRLVFWDPQSVVRGRVAFWFPVELLTGPSGLQEAEEGRQPPLLPGHQRKRQATGLSDQEDGSDLLLRESSWMLCQVQGMAVSAP